MQSLTNTRIHILRWPLRRHISIPSQTSTLTKRCSPTSTAHHNAAHIRRSTNNVLFLRPLLSSSITPITTATSSFSTKSATIDSTTTTSKSTKDEDSNLFLDHLGKIFLAGIATIILLLVRSSKGTTNRTNLRHDIETQSLLDPLEIDDLREANSEFSPQVFEAILKNVVEAFPTNEATYFDFISVVIQTMRELKGEAFTVELGHLLDRVAIEIMQSDEKDSKTLPLPFLLTILSLALHSSVEDRVTLLFRSMQQERVSEKDIVAMIQYLQKTCQLVPGSQIVPSDVKYPIQKYKRGSAEELVSKAKEELKDVLLQKDGYDAKDFEAILKSSYVCAWGECYSPGGGKKKK